MSIAYKNVITRLDVKSSDTEIVAEVVGYLHGRDSVTDNSYTCAFIIPLETEEITGFIPYENLTPEIVEQWVSDRIDQDTLTKMKQSISDKLQEISGQSRNENSALRELPW